MLQDLSLKTAILSYFPADFKCGILLFIAKYFYNNYERRKIFLLLSNFIGVNYGKIV